MQYPIRLTLLALLLSLVACESEDSTNTTTDGGGTDGSASQDSGSGLPDSGSRADAGGGDAGGGGGLAGFPDLPPDATAGDKTGFIALRVSESTSDHLANGDYGAPHTANGSSKGTAAFLDGITGALQVNINTGWGDKKDVDYTCDGVSDILVRYGSPPSGFNQILTEECALKATYNAQDGTYEGTFEGTFGDGLTMPSKDKTLAAKARFIFEEGGLRGGGLFRHDRRGTRRPHGLRRRNRHRDLGANRRRDKVRKIRGGPRVRHHPGTRLYEGRHGEAPLRRRTVRLPRPAFAPG
ncbi:MAG: hypothetical protein KC416_04835 [Myxococcales bacterium]|nr:hypothetical protein [Myxococcales bacterium]